MRASKSKTEAILNDLRNAISFYAWSYEGKGAEHDDLLQEGFLAALKVIRNKSEKAAYRSFGTSLRGMVRDAAARLRRRPDTIQISICARDDGEATYMEDFIADDATADAAETVELMSDIERRLGAKDMEIVRLLIEGYTHAEIGRELDISQQAVSVKIAKIRQTLQPLRERYY
jgi:RNA polymerase sigma factor (sigma-70 family)